MQLRRVTVRRYRRLRALTWHPGRGINCLVGEGDIGKSSILDAIALALHPAPVGPASEYDYHRRQVDDAYAIELVLGQLGDALLAAFQPPPLHGWNPEHRELLLAPEDGAEPVLLVRARGTPELDVEHRLVAPNGEERALSTRARQDFGLCAAGGSRPAYREFRMSRGSLLERIIGREEMRARAVDVLKGASAGLQIPEPAKAELDRLRKRLDAEGVAPGELSLALLSPPGQNLLGFLGLAAGERAEAIPLGFHGQGTQRIAAFLLALELASESPIITLDEAELGLEPYRQRQLMRWLREVIGNKGQAFVTTHSPAVVGELAVDEVHRVTCSDGDGVTELVRLGRDLEGIMRADPEALLSRLPVVAEGATEAGLLDVLLNAEASKTGQSLHGLGLHVLEGGGQPDSLRLAGALLSAGFSVGGFFDEQPEHSGTRKGLAERGAILGGFGYASAEEAIITTLPLGALDRLLDLEVPGGLDRIGRVHQLTAALRQQARPTFEELVQLAGGEAGLRRLITQVALDRTWFKSRHAARRLGRFLLTEGLPEELSRPFKEAWERLLGALAAEAPRDAGQDSDVKPQ